MSDPDKGGTARTKVRMPAPLLGLFGLFVGLGIGGLVLGTFSDPVRAWRAYLVNFLFFTGIGSGGVLFACVLNMASGRWGRNLKRVAEGLGLFLPISLLLFLFMIPGLDKILPWVHHPYGPAWWLDLEFLIWRNIVGLALLAGLGLYLIYSSLRVDFGTFRDEDRPAKDSWIFRSWKGDDEEVRAARKRMVVLSPVYAILFAVVMTVIGVDLIMSLEPGWYSTLIGAYYFVGSFYVALAALMVAVIWTRRRYGLHHVIRPGHLHDAAKLTMAFGVVTGDFFYTQLLVIWYGNLPNGIGFLIDRMTETPWRIVGILVLVLCFGLPLAAMLRQSLKERSGPMLLFAAAVLGAMWLERFLLIGPSVTGSGALLFGPTEIMITLGFVGLLGLTFTFFIHRVPPVVLRDPVLDV